MIIYCFLYYFMGLLFRKGSLGIPVSHFLLLLTSFPASLLAEVKDTNTFSADLSFNSDLSAKSGFVLLK